MRYNYIISTIIVSRSRLLSCFDHVYQRCDVVARTSNRLPTEGRDGDSTPPAASRRVASRRVASRRVASRRVASRRVASRRVASRRVASRRVASRRVASRRVASRRDPGQLSPQDKLTLYLFVVQNYKLGLACINYVPCAG